MGFKLWMEDNNTMPTPSDIARIINQWNYKNNYKPPEGRTHFPSDEEIQNVSAMMEEMRNNLQPEDQIPNSEKNGKQNYSHFERSSPEQQQQAISNLKNMVRH